MSSDTSYSKVIEIPCTELTGFSVRLEVVKSHMEGDTMVLDEVKLIDVNYDGSQPSVTEEEAEEMYRIVTKALEILGGG